MVKDGQDGNGLDLKASGGLFSSFFPCVLDEIGRNAFWHVFPLNIYSLDVIALVICCLKVFHEGAKEFN